MYKWLLVTVGLLLFSFTLFAQSNELIAKVLTTLDVSLEDCHESFIIEKQLPYDSLISIMVIPILTEFSDESAFSLNAYILMVNNQTGNIYNQFYEKDIWISDAIRIGNISVDTAPYLLNSNTRAFGIRVQYYGSSKPNPYSEVNLSLFVPEEKTLKKVLNEYVVNQFSGEWNMICAGEFVREDKILIVSKEQTNGFSDIIIKNNVTYINAINKNGDCVEQEKTEKKMEVLKFDGIQYQLTNSKK